jgi:hypothetical protein
VSNDDNVSEVNDDNNSLFSHEDAFDCKALCVVMQEEAGVCVYLSSGFKGQCFNYAIPIAKSYPPMTSLPYLGLVVLPLRTPRGDLARRVSN